LFENLVFGPTIETIGDDAVVARGSQGLDLGDNTLGIGAFTFFGSDIFTDKFLILFVDFKPTALNLIDSNTTEVDTRQTFFVHQMVNAEALTGAGHANQNQDFYIFHAMYCTTCSPDHRP